MEKIYVLVALVLGCLFVGNAEAASARCEGCSDSQFIAKAKQLGVGEHVITSFSTNKVKIFNVRDSSGGEPGVPVVLRAIPVAVSADIQAAFGDVHAFYLQTAGTMKAGATIYAEELKDDLPGIERASAFDIMKNATLKAQLGGVLSGPLPMLPGMERAGEMILQGAFAFFGVGDGSYELTIVFADGSKVVFMLNHRSSSAQYQADQSRTSDGQLIPEANAQQYQGTWSGSSVSGLAEHMSGLGAAITLIGTGTSGGSMTCTWDGRTLKCNLQRF